MREHGSLHSRTGSDYFIFPRACFKDIPDFTVGRAGWDNWMIYQARRQGWDAVDCSEDLDIIHQIMTTAISLVGNRTIVCLKPVKISIWLVEDAPFSAG